MKEEKVKYTKKEFATKGYNGSTIILPAKTKVYKDANGKYTETIFGDFPFQEKDLTDEE